MMKNTTDQVFAHNTESTIFVVLMSTYVVVFNVTVLVTTINCRLLSSCPVNRLLMSSYVGNMFGIASICANEIYKTCNETKQSIDGYFFLYLGLMTNVITLAVTSYTRHRAITLDKKTTKVECSGLIKVVILAWCISLTVAAVLTATGDLWNEKVAIKGCIATVIPIIFSGIYYTRLLYFLKRRQKNTAEREISVQKLQRGIIIIQFTITAYVAFLITTLTTLMAMKHLSHQQVDVQFAALWIARVMYAIVFTIEGVVFLYKTPNARRNIRHTLGCEKRSTDCKISTDEKRTGATEGNK